jgi:hypothetical protein
MSSPQRLRAVKKPSRFEDVLLGLNQQWALLDAEPGYVIRLTDGKVITARRFWDFVSPIQIYDNDGKKLNAGRVWMNWSQPRRVAREIFLPKPIGESPAPGFVELYQGETCYNHWRGWPSTLASEVDSQAIDAYHRVRNWLFSEQLEIAEWLERWIAYKLSHPTVKQPNIPILIGPQGCGKDTLVRFFAALFGQHADHIPGSRINSRFNAFMGNKLFLNVSELENASAQFFKDIVSNKVGFIERKGIDPVTVPSYVQFFATSNERVPYLLKADDRRAGIFRACKDKKDEYAARINTQLVEKLENVIADPKNLAGIYPYFVERDSADYNPYAEPPRTTDKEDLIRQHRSDCEQFIRDVIANPDDCWVNYVNLNLEPRRCDLACVKDFAGLANAPGSLEPLLKDHRGETTIGKWLAEILPRGTVNGGKQVRTKHGLRRLWPVRNPDKWYQAKHDEIAQHYNK